MADASTWLRGITDPIGVISGNMDTSERQ